MDEFIKENGFSIAERKSNPIFEVDNMH